MEAEEKTQRQLEARILELKRKNRKSNVAFAQLQENQFKEDEEEEEKVHTPKTQIKRTKQSTQDDREEDPKVILRSDER